MKWIFIFFAATAGSILCSVLYYRFALRFGPLAHPNHRSLHSKPVPRGGGLAIALAALPVFLWLSLAGDLTNAQTMLYVVGALVICALGAVDDRCDLAPRYRLPIQLFAGLWVLYWIGGFFRWDIGTVSIELGWVGQGMLLVLMVWLYNAFNFVDGTDGMASTASLFISATMAGILAARGQTGIALVLATLACASAGFLVFNHPPARLFMGDAGSSLIAYVLVAALLDSCRHEGWLVWVWAIVAAFYISDTTLTTWTRAIRTPRFWEGHRSHAYQNLARLWGSHAKILGLVVAINLFWILPLTLLAVKAPAQVGWILVLAYAPLLAFSGRFGPLFQDK